MKLLQEMKDYPVRKFRAM